MPTSILEKMHKPNNKRKCAACGTILSSYSIAETHTPILRCKNKFCNNIK